MIMDKIPAGLVPSSGSFIFTEDTIPAALQREHTLAPGHWGVLHVFEGSIRFVDLGDRRRASGYRPRPHHHSPRGPTPSGCGEPTAQSGRLLSGSRC